MIEAERLLFEEALQDPANQRFVLLSDRLSSLQPQKSVLHKLEIPSFFVCISFILYSILDVMKVEKRNLSSG